MKKILLLEDDLSLINGLSFAFKKQGYELDNARTVKEAQAFWKTENYDMLVIDVTLPDGSGFDFCREVRQTSKVPIIFLTALDDEINTIMGLDMGADDYITKPFKLGGLLSRINALLRRARDFHTEDTQLCSNGIVIDLLQSRVLKGNEVLDLTAGEYKLLCLLSKNVGKVLTHTYITQNIWGRSWDNDVASLRVFMATLRKKLESAPDSPQYIQTHIGIGYRMLKIE